jgi:hypothetical protein
MTSRRGFLAAVSAAVGAFALDPEFALWKPGAKLISIPSPAVRSVLIPTSEMNRVIVERFRESLRFMDLMRQEQRRDRDFVAGDRWIITDPRQSP